MGKNETRSLNKLRIIEKIQSIYSDYKEKGLSDKIILREYIYPIYFISMVTFKRYLNVDVAAEREKIAKRESITGRQ